MNRLLVCIIVITISFSLSGEKPGNDFDTFMKGALTDFDAFIDDADREFLDFMRNPWKKYQARKPVEKRRVPEPERPVTVVPEDTVGSKPSPRQLTIEEILDLTTRESGHRPVVKAIPQEVVPGMDEPQHAPERRPTAPLTVDRPVSPVTRPDRKPVKKDDEKVPGQNKAAPSAPLTPPKASPRPATPLYAGGEGRLPVTFAGVTYHVSPKLKNAITLHRLDENSVTDAYEALLRSDYKPLVADLASLKDKGLNGEWALFMFIKQISEAFVGRDESKVMRQFLLNRLGYRARVARNTGTGHLTIFVAPDCGLYGVISINTDGVTYYDVDATRPYYFLMCSKDAPGSTRRLRMEFASAPYLGDTRKTMTHTSPRTKVSATVSVPVSLIEFYKNIPQCDYSVYANSGVDKMVESQLLGSLRHCVSGRNEKDAAMILLDFVQNGFEYATDDVQFGYEKPFFVEELFYYPKCDCEDRAVLFRYLVMRLLGLDTVLLEYPNHIATAVAFRDNVAGDYVMVGGRKYTVCDPTYIGAGIGMTMPQFRNTKAKVLKI